MFFDNKKLLIIMLFSVASVLFSCGNIINETVLAHDENSHSIDEDDNSGIVFTEMNRIFSTSGDIRIKKREMKDTA